MLRGRRAAVLGAPVSHSLSPALHRAAYAALALDGWTYDVTRVEADDLASHVAGLGPEWVGLSLTMPLKEVALDVAAAGGRVGDVARATGAANTLVRRSDGGWDADNTDVDGIVDALAEAGVAAVDSAVVVGSGATARSAVAALARLGAQRVTFMVRDAVRPATSRQARDAGLEVAVVAPGAWPPAADVVVSTVPPVATAPWADGLPVAGERAALLDVVYGSGATPLTRSAHARGYAVVPGTAMLLHQAVRQVELMTGRTAPVAVMRAALAEALAARETER